MKIQIRTIHQLYQDK